MRRPKRAMQKRRQHDPRSLVISLGARLRSHMTLTEGNRSMTAPLVLSLDLDDTLWPVAPVIAAAENALLAWLRTRYPRAVSGHDVESLRVLRAAVNERFPEHGHDLTFLRHRALKDLFGAAGHAESLADEGLGGF